MNKLFGGTGLCKHNLIAQFCPHCEIASLQQHLTAALAERDTWLAAYDAIYSECKELKAENANLRAAVRGRTMYHSDEVVMQELGEVRAERDEALKQRDLWEKRWKWQGETLAQIGYDSTKSTEEVIKVLMALATSLEQERDGARERVKELDEFYNKSCVKIAEMNECNIALAAQLDTAWQQGAEAMREAAAEEANEWAYGYVTEDTAPCRVGDKIRVLPVPERKER